MAHSPFRFITPDTRLRFTQLAIDREAERSRRLDELEANLRRFREIEQGFRPPSSPIIGGLGEAAGFQRPEVQEAVLRGREFTTRRRAPPDFSEAPEAIRGAGDIRFGTAPTAPLTPEGISLEEAQALRQLGLRTGNRTIGISPSGEAVLPSETQPVALEQAERLQTRFFDPIAAQGAQVVDVATFPGVLIGQAEREAEQALGGREAPELTGPPTLQRGVVNAPAAILGDEEEIAKAQTILNEDMSLPASLAARLLFAPDLLVPGIGFTKIDDFARLLKTATTATGAGRVRALNALRNSDLLKEARRGFIQAGEAGGRPPTGPLRGGQPPREPPTAPPPKGARGPEPDDEVFRRIQDQVLGGEKPEITLIRRHEGAINTAKREAAIGVEEGNKLLRQGKIGQSFRGTVAPRAGQVDEFDELYRFLHNPSRVESGELVVPARLRPTYDKLRELTDWEQVARLDFDPEMALVEDYFYRGWKPPEGMFAGDSPVRGPLGRKPGFKMPRVDATFEEMRAAGFEPLFWNPFEQWRASRMMGVRYREQMKLVEDIKQLGLAEVHTGGPIPEGWRVPRVGPAFEGKPYAIVDEAGNPRPMFTRRWIVPDTMADRLENVYGVAPQLGKVEVAGRAFNLAKVVDAITFIPKRAKLIASVFQHVDFLSRSHIGAWTGLVDALRAGKPVAAVTHLAKWPKSAATILRASVSPGFRQNLRRMSLDTAPLVAERPGLTMRSVSEAGLSLQDVTILPANIDDIAREVAQEAVAAKAIKAPPRALLAFERVHRQGLFQGVYPAAILTDIKNNIAPIMVRNYPNLTDAQLAGQIAKVANKKYSTIPASMSVVQNRTMREVLRRTFFSINENEGLLRQAAGVLPGPEAAFWREHWLGAFIGLTAAANVIHFASTGQPLPFARYSPLSRDKWGVLPIGYNRDFAAPDIPLTGRSGTQITLDLVGQLDTALRILDPKSFISARESVPVRTIQNQLTGTDFFGAPIDEVGPEGIVSRTSQLIFDMFAPIGVGQSALELARSNIEGAETIIRPGEDRLGTQGTLTQATGVNLRAETTPQLLDRIRAEVMQEKGIEGSYEDIKATDSPLANEIDDEVEKRIGEELELRRETAEIRGQTTPQSQGFEAIETTREVQQTEQLADDTNLNSGQWAGNVWREKFRDRQRDFFNRREQIKADFQIEFDEKEAPSGSVNAAINAYFNVNVDDFAQPDGEVDWDGFFNARDSALSGLAAGDKRRVMKFLRKFDTPTVTEFRRAQDVVDRFFEKPKYKNLTLEQGEEADRILNEDVPTLQTQALKEGIELERTDAVHFIIERTAVSDEVKDWLQRRFRKPRSQIVKDVLRDRLRAAGVPADVIRRIVDRPGPKLETLVNPERDTILLENQELLAKFYPDLLQRQLSREQEASLGQQAFAAVAR